MIVLTLSLEVDGKCKMIQVDSITPGDFAIGPGHMVTAYLEPMSEIMFDAYRQLTDETVRSAMDRADERQSISKRLSKIGMV